mmetsp:Transcript_43470/g.94443  ORF Transcript_43470/g.94443 Transcript_43470/m.94443 type:complete len:297 (+) Transcript_43470:328-1218(+)
MIGHCWYSIVLHLLARVGGPTSDDGTCRCHHAFAASDLRDGLLASVEDAKANAKAKYQDCYGNTNDHTNWQATRWNSSNILQTPWLSSIVGTLIGIISAIHVICAVRLALFHVLPDSIIRQIFKAHCRHREVHDVCGCRGIFEDLGHQGVDLCDTQTLGVDVGLHRGRTRRRALQAPHTVVRVEGQAGALHFLERDVQHISDCQPGVVKCLVLPFVPASLVALHRQAPTGHGFYPDATLGAHTLATCHHGVRAACVGAGGGEVIEELLFHEALIDGREFQGIPIHFRHLIINDLFN